MQKVRFLSIALVSASTLLASQISYAQAPGRAARIEARQDRQAARLGNRAQYYNQQTWTQLDPWISRNQVRPAPRVARAANVAANVTERALNTGANVANNAAVAANARFGYTNPNVATTPQGWFYDYYTYNPTFYAAPASGATVYGSAARYYDLNNDGVYDSLSTFRDADSNGAYDVYDRYDFAENSNDKNNDGIVDGPTDANRHTVTGTINATKVAKVNGLESLVVRVADANANANSQATIVDLGSVELWPAQSIKEGDQLTATGPVEQIGDKVVLMAETAAVGNQKAVTIQRFAPRLEGQVVDVTRAEVKGAEHTMVIIESGSGRQIVDLGPADRLKFKVEPQMKIAVQGVPVQLRDHSVVLADRVDLNGQQVVIERW